METVVEFRAGLMKFEDKVLKADPRKGLLRIAQDDQGMTHLLWLERAAAGGAAPDPEVDAIIFPGEASFEKVDRPGARVFLLKFPEEKDRNAFFWAQEPDASLDAAHVAAVNSALSVELAPMEEEEPPAAAVGAPAAVAGAPAAAGGGAIAASQLASVLGSLLGGAAGAQQAAQPDPGPDLSEVLRPEALAPLLSSPRLLDRLAPHLPEGHRSAEAVAALVATPQFRHQLRLLSAALQTGALDASQFGLGQGQAYGVLEFLHAIQRAADQERGQEQPQQEQPQQGQPGGQQEQQGGGSAEPGGGQP